MLFHSRNASLLIAWHIDWLAYTIFCIVNSRLANQQVNNPFFLENLHNVVGELCFFKPCRL